MIRTLAPLKIQVHELYLENNTGVSDIEAKKTYQVVAERSGTAQIKNERFETLSFGIITKNQRLKFVPSEVCYVGVDEEQYVVSQESIEEHEKGAEKKNGSKVEPKKNGSGNKKGGTSGGSKKK